MPAEGLVESFENKLLYRSAGFFSGKDGGIITAAHALTGGGRAFVVLVSPALPRQGDQIFVVCMRQSQWTLCPTVVLGSTEAAGFGPSIQIKPLGEQPPIAGPLVTDRGEVAGFLQTLERDDSDPSDNGVVVPGHFFIRPKWTTGRLSKAPLRNHRRAAGDFYCY